MEKTLAFCCMYVRQTNIGNHVHSLVHASLTYMVAYRLHIFLRNVPIECHEASELHNCIYCERLLLELTLQRKHSPNLAR